MFWCGMNGDTAEWWECHFTPAAAGIYFYYFECRTNRGIRALMRGAESKAVLHGFDRWQLTVFDAFTTPDWLKGGLIYQIFPDRFYKGGNTAGTIPAGRILHENWQEEVGWRPGADGEIHNNDFFGGNLKGIEEKLPYLQSLGVTCIYLNPIFESPSNHRYDTADYTKIDPLLGTEEDFISLCRAAQTLAIRILLDGVFSHTGSDSVYFNRQARYPNEGAYQSQQSPYFAWYHFNEWPKNYDCWWGFITLPNVNETNPHYNNYINGETGVVRKWLRLGAAGWRLDVADELPDEFLDHLRLAVKAEKPSALVMGEVWEDATNKMAYGVLRRYLLGKQLDSVMNYPFRYAILSYVLQGDSQTFFETIFSVIENYPPQSLHVLMNSLGTHDTERILTLLGGVTTAGLDREAQSRIVLSPQEMNLAVQRLKLASLLQYTLPGVPSLYYGDEAGLEGAKDPFNRRTFPWGKENTELTAWYRALGELRQHYPCLGDGVFEKVYGEGNLIAYCRTQQDSKTKLLIIANSGEKPCSASGIIPPNIRLLLSNGTICDEEISGLTCGIYLAENA